MLRAFLFGAAGYPLLEIIWRGRTHPSMALAGGLAMGLIHRISRQRGNAFVKVLRCAAGITAIEAGIGLIFNRRHQVWDYRCMPCNWRGQICLPYAAAWTVLSAVGLQLDKALQRA